MQRCRVRTGHSITAAGSYTFLFGGKREADNVKTDELFYLHMDRLEWTKVSGGFGRAYCDCGRHSFRVTYIVPITVTSTHALCIFPLFRPTPPGAGQRHAAPATRRPHGHTLTPSLSSPPFPARRLKVPDSGTPPPPRDGHTAVYDPETERLIVFGGRSGERKRTNDLYYLDIATMQVSGGLRGGGLGQFNRASVKLTELRSSRPVPRVLINLTEKLTEPRSI